MAEAEFVNVLICIGCTEVLIEPYMSCNLAHKFCMECAHMRLHRCTVCTNPLVDPEILRGDFPCVNFRYGCKFGGNMADCADHQEDCDLGPIPCPFDTEEKKCIWNGQLNTIWLHFEKYHRYAIRWNNRDLVSRRDTLTNLRHYISSVPSQEMWKDCCIVFRIQEDVFFVKFSLCSSGKLKYYVEYLAIPDVVKEKGFKYRITFGAPNSVGSCTGNDCGKPSYMAFKDIINLCDSQGNLPFEITVYDKNSPEDDSAFEMVYNE